VSHRPEDPLLAALVDNVYGRDYYTQVWNSRPWYVKLWAHITGTNPGGRKGAPALKEGA
jgi:hypothetical protein